jgi:hypothetical protein
LCREKKFNKDETRKGFFSKLFLAKKAPNYYKGTLAAAAVNFIGYEQTH